MRKISIITTKNKFNLPISGFLYIILFFLAATITMVKTCKPGILLSGDAGKIKTIKRTGLLRTVKAGLVKSDFLGYSAIRLHGRK